MGAFGLSTNPQNQNKIEKPTEQSEDKTPEMVYNKELKRWILRGKIYDDKNINNTGASITKVTEITDITCNQVTATTSTKDIFSCEDAISDKLNMPKKTPLPPKILPIKKIPTSDPQTNISSITTPIGNTKTTKSIFNPPKSNKISNPFVPSKPSTTVKNKSNVKPIQNRYTSYLDNYN